jgi:hypothetical protein
MDNFSWDKIMAAKEQVSNDSEEYQDTTEKSSKN